MIACVSVPLTVTPRIACGSLIPPELRADVPGVQPPSGSVGNYAAAFDGQTGRLDTANSNKHAAIGITDRCDAINAELASRVTAPWWAFWRR